MWKTPGPPPSYSPLRQVIRGAGEVVAVGHDELDIAITDEEALPLPRRPLLYAGVRTAMTRLSIPPITRSPEHRRLQSWIKNPVPSPAVWRALTSRSTRMPPTDGQSSRRNSARSSRSPKSVVCIIATSGERPEPAPPVRHARDRPSVRPLAARPKLGASFRRGPAGPNCRRVPWLVARVAVVNRVG